MKLGQPVNRIVGIPFPPAIMIDRLFHPNIADRKNRRCVPNLVHKRNESILDNRAVLNPILAVLLTTPLKVPPTPMRQHCQEKGRVVVRNDGPSSCNRTPKESLCPISGVVRLTQELPPAIDEQRITMLSLQIPGILKCGPRPLRESPSMLESSLQLHPKARLLSHGGIEHVVCKDEKGEHKGVGRGAELVVRRRMSSHVDDRVAVGEGYTGKVPEDDHEAPFFVEHVPCLRDTFFSLTASIDVKTGSKNHESHVRGNIAVDVVLLASTTDAD